MKAATLLSKKYKELFNFTRKAIEESLNFLGGENANTVERQVTLLHFARAAYLLDAIYRLALQGLATEAMVILRSLLNLYINIKWLTKDDSKKSFERYADFEVVYRKLTLDNVKKYGGIGDKIKNYNLKIHDKDFERVKKKYNLNKRKDFFNWSGRSIYQMAKDVNLENSYKIIYGELSSIEHTGPGSVRHYLDDSEKGKTKIKAGPRDEDIDSVLLTALEYYFKVKAITHDIFELEWPDLESDENMYLELKKKYWENPAETI